MFKYHTNNTIIFWSYSLILMSFSWGTAPQTSFIAGYSHSYKHCMSKHTKIKYKLANVCMLPSVEDNKTNDRS